MRDVLSKIARRFIGNEFLYETGTKVFFWFYNVYCYFKYGYAEFFWGISLEISTYCNRRCYYCPNSRHRTPKKFMSDELFKRIIGNLRAIGYIGGVSYQFYGEPLLDKRLVEFVRYTKENLPKALFIKVLSNGDYLTMELFERLIDAGMKEISITIHDLGPARMLEKLRPMMKKHPSNMRVNTIHGSKALSNRGGTIDIENDAANKKCLYMRGLNIDYEGNALLCCGDYFRAHKFGNVKEERIEHIWRKKEFERARKLARAGKPVLDICKKCLNVD